MNTSPITKDVIATKLWFDGDKMCLSLKDGRDIFVPISWFSSLQNASKAQRENFRFICGGEGIHWDDLDEDISVEGLLY